MFTYKHFSAGRFLLDRFDFERELAMEAYIFENPKVLSLDEDDFGEVSILDYELPVKDGRNTRNGRIDFLASYGEDYLAVVELKVGVLNQNHLNQLKDYLEHRHEIEKTLEKDGDSGEKKWVGILVGTGIESSLAVEITEGRVIAEGCQIAAIVLSRFGGEDGQVYVISDIYSAVKKSDKDRTKYEFEGNTYGKGRLVLAVIKAYVRDHKNITFTELRNTFPESLQKSYGIFQMLESDKVKRSRVKGYKRFYFGEDEIIELNDRDKTKIVVSSQWGTGDGEWHGKVGGFVEHCKKMGMQIKPVPRT